MNTVIQVVQHLSPGGIEVMALELKKKNDHKHPMIIISLEGNKASALKRWPRLKEFANDIIFLNKKPGWDYSVYRRLAKLFRKLKPLAVHTHHIGPLVYAGSAAKVCGIKKVIHTEHDAWHLDNKKRCLLERIALYFVRPTLVADADIVAQNMKNKLKRSEVHVIKNGIDIQHFNPGNATQARQDLMLPTGVKLIGTAGRLEAVKGQAYLIKALKCLPEDVHLAIAGKGSLREQLESTCYELNIQDRVWFLGNVEDMPQFYQALDAFCLPSLQEGLPLSVLEAQACGIPAVVTNVGGACESLCKQSGILVPAQNVRALSEALTTILFNQNQVNPREYVEKQGNLQNMARAYAELCRDKGEAA